MTVRTGGDITIAERRGVGPPGRRTAVDPDQHRLLQDGLEKARRVRLDRHPAEDFLVLDMLGPGRTQSLHGQVEGVRVARRDAVVIDGGAQEFPRAGALRDELERSALARQGQRRRPATVDDAHDNRRFTAVVEVLFDRVGQHARLPQAAEHRLVFGEARHGDRPVERTAQGTADERRDGRRDRDDPLSRTRLPRNLHAACQVLRQRDFPPVVLFCHL